KIAEASAKHLTPAVLELGGQDAAIVCEDADLDVASSGVLWGSLLNAGQTCCAIERAYVSERVADEFERLLTDKARKLRRGDDVGRRAKQEGFNLTASVWSTNRRRAELIASRLVAGSVTINDHAVTAGAPWGLWGGVGQSGYGRLHGRLGLREFAVPVHVARN